MEIVGKSLDDVLIALYRELPIAGIRNKGTRGDTVEILGVSLRIETPRARLSRSEDRGKIFSALAELLWYFSRTNDVSFIAPYIPAYRKEADEDGTVHGGYGPRIFSMRDKINQFDSVIRLLRDKPTSRRAVIQLFNAEDISDHHREVPCTTTLQFFQRDNRLHLAATLRSNDAYKGLPHDVFCFTMIQEIMASTLSLELGTYYQFVGSMHVYSDNMADLNAYSDEGYQRHTEMPTMPTNDPFPVLETLLKCESRMRAGENFNASEYFQDSYWADIARLLQSYWATGNEERLTELSAEITFKEYRSYIEARKTMNPIRFN